MMNKEELKSGILNALHGIDPKTATPQQLHQALGETIMEAIAPDWNKSMDAHERSRRACYFSMEFLVGRAVYNNLLVLDVMKEAEAALQNWAFRWQTWKLSKMPLWATAVWADWLPASWTAQQRWICRWMAMASATSTVCSSSTSRTDSRRKCRTTGCATAMPGRCAGTRMLFWWNSRDRPFVPCRMICR